MPGSSFITGLAPCSNIRRIFGESKPRTVTFDLEIFLGLDNEGRISVIPAVGHYYVQNDESEIKESKIYLIAGRVSSVSEATSVGEGYDAAAYDLEIDMVSMNEMSRVVEPVRPMITIAGQAKPSGEDRKVNIDVTQYIAGTSDRLAAHTCLLSETNRRFKKPPMPPPNSFISITGNFYHESITDAAGIRRLQVEVVDISFLASKSSLSPVKGKVSKMTWGGSSPSRLRSHSPTPTPSKKTSSKKRARESLESPSPPLPPSPPTTRHRSQVNAEAGPSSGSATKRRRLSSAEKTKNKGKGKAKVDVVDKEASSALSDPFTDGDNNSSDAIEIVEVTKKGSGKKVSKR